MSEFYWRVSQLVQYLKLRLDSDLKIQNIMVEGEVSNFTHHNSGHLYFSIKDEKSTIRCVMFASNAASVNFPIKNGDSVIIQTKVSVFEVQGQLQLYVQKIQPSGIGALYLQLEELKKKLSLEGCFDIEKKKKIPAYPLKIGVITGDNTAAKRDVLTTLQRRWPLAQVCEYNALVQGEGAYKTIIEALINAEQENLDVLLLVRGGGSLEDLWNFNEEELVRVILRLKTPIITGVGHETDTTLVDYVADQRAATPTAAAELATPDIKEVHRHLHSFSQRMFQTIDTKRNTEQMKLDYFRNRNVFQNPRNLLIHQEFKLRDYEKRLSSWAQIIYQSRANLNDLLMRLPLQANSITHSVSNRIKTYESRLKQAMEFRKNNQKHQMMNTISLLDAYSPLNTLKRGYSITTINNQALKGINDVVIGDFINTSLSDGNICSKIVSKESKYDKE